MNKDLSPLGFSGNPEITEIFDSSPGHIDGGPANAKDHELQSDAVGASPATISIDALLSARHYPLSSSFNSSSLAESPNIDMPMLYGGLVPTDPLDSLPRARTGQNEMNENEVPSSDRHNLFEPDDSPFNKSSSQKIQGRPRTVLEDSAVRRRTQVREAQRAYRARKEARIVGLSSRVSLLEKTLQHVTGRISLLRDPAVWLGPISFDSNTKYQIQATLKACIDIAQHALKSDNIEIFENSLRRADGVRCTDLHTHSIIPSLSHFPSQMNNITTSTSQQILRFSCSPPDGRSPLLQISDFIDRLHLACLYQGYSALSDRFITRKHLEYKFRLLFTLMDRQNAASYFKSLLDAKINHTVPEELKKMPHFDIGGAGTHFARRLSLSTIDTYSENSTLDILSHFPAHVQEEMQGDWFDLNDLKGYLQENGIPLVDLNPSIETSNLRNQGAVKVSRLEEVLKKKAICLGRLPGFRRKDVEEAIDAAMQ